MSVIRAQRIVKNYRLGEVDVEVLKGVDLDIDKGEYVALMGPSGSGKSTLMNILGCLDVPTSGQYYIDQQEVSKLTDDQLAVVRGERIGFVFQTFNLLARTSAIENVELPLHYQGKPAREAALKALESVGLAHRYDHKPNQLSGGERQRVAIARAIVTSPSIILADEPTGNLDSRTGVEILGIFDELSRRGVTIVLVTHDPTVARHAHRVIHLKDGRIERVEVNDHQAALTESP
ncbi:MAG TPA: ABC transporter ATP-binding protein [Planctomycetota bacterium]|nr:ABC transporter ATP-binding protein [Planctomycetota bacterium]